MTRLMSSRDRSATDAPRGISKLELAKFLAQLADLYASPEYGNSALAEALRELAATVKRTDPTEARGNKPKGKGYPQLSLDQLNELKALDHESIRIFLTDEKKTKAELLGLASARFSMPISQLKRMSTAEVRQAIDAARLHESSIEILSEESTRDGANRKS